MTRRALISLACGLALLCTACAALMPNAATTQAKDKAMTATIYDAFHLHDDDTPAPLGKIAITGGVLSIVSLTDEASRNAVQKSLDDLNNRAFLVQKSPPAEGSGERYGLGATEYERGQVGFDEVLIKKLESSHDIRLTPIR